MVVAIDDPRRIVTTAMKTLDTLDAECSEPDCTERSWGWIELSEREQEVRRFDGRGRAKEEALCFDHSKQRLVTNLRELQAVWEVLHE